MVDVVDGALYVLFFVIQRVQLIDVGVVYEFVGFEGLDIVLYGDEFFIFDGVFVFGGV